jgi:hypothetical protein
MLIAQGQLRVQGNLRRCVSVAGGRVRRTSLAVPWWSEAVHVVRGTRTIDVRVTEGDAGEEPQVRGAGAGETLQDTGKQEETNTAIRTKTC